MTTPPLICYVLRTDTGAIFCGAHPWETREEAARARDGMFGDGLGVPEVVELVEVRAEGGDVSDDQRAAVEAHAKCAELLSYEQKRANDAEAALDAIRCAVSRWSDSVPDGLLDVAFPDEKPDEESDE